MNIPAILTTAAGLVNVTQIRSLTIPKLDQVVGVDFSGPAVSGKTAWLAEFEVRPSGLPLCPLRLDPVGSLAGCDRPGVIAGLPFADTWWTAFGRLSKQPGGWIFRSVCRSSWICEVGTINSNTPQPIRVMPESSVENLSKSRSKLTITAQSRIAVVIDFEGRVYC